MLEGIKVVEYATYMAAPGAGSILSDWGADVVKIEPPGGDPIRLFFKTIGTDITDNPVFDFDNRGKKSIVVDTSKPEGQELVRKLVADADVFLTNVRPGGLERSGLDYDSLKELNTKLVYCSLTGYGLQGPDANRPDESSSKSGNNKGGKAIGDLGRWRAHSRCNLILSFYSALCA